VKLRVAIVDDERPARDRLRRLLAAMPEVELVGEAGDVASAVELIDTEKPDLCLLDVQIPGGDGFEVLRLAAHMPQVVFTTAFDHYAVRAFEVKSLDYLLKPVHRDRLLDAVRRAQRTRERGATESGTVQRLIEEIRAQRPAPAPQRIPAKRGAKILLLDPTEVIWFESEGELVHARTADGRALVERPLSELEELLAGSYFRIHRSYLVNLSRVGAIVPEDGGTYRVVMKDEGHTALPLSRRQAQKLREIIPW
jgi:two-component system, LytTR family, response regulator